jgi:hypothetical protein
MKAKCVALLVGLGTAYNVLFGVTQASAITLLDTIGSETFCACSDVFIYSIPSTNLPTGPFGQSLGVTFTSASTVTITGVTAFIAPGDNTNSLIDLGIMADAGGLPSGTFLDDTTVTPTNAAPVSLSPNWVISAGTYWLVAESVPVLPGPNVNFWQFGTTGVGAAFAFPSINAVWRPSAETGAALITADVVATPLPAALPLFATGLGGLSLLGWLRKRKGQAV